MNLYPTIPDERAKEYDAACEARGETRESYAERVLLASLRAPKEAPKVAEVAPEALKPVEASEPKKKAGG